MYSNLTSQQLNSESVNALIIRVTRHNLCIITYTRKYNAFHRINTSIARGAKRKRPTIMIMNATLKGSTPNHTFRVRPVIGKGHLRSLPTETAGECEVLGLTRNIISHVHSKHVERGDAHGNTY
jgi:hypothetical protein